MPFILLMLQEVVEFTDDGGMGGISSSETSDAVASVLPGVEGDQVQVTAEGGEAYEEVMDFVEEQVVTAEQVVADDEQVQHQQEEVVINGEDGEQVVFVTDTGRVTVGSNSGGAGEVGGDFFVQDADLTGGDAVIQMQEEEIIETPSSETEMSVAMEMAKLSQGGDSGAIYTSPNGTIYQTEEVYSNGYYDDDAGDSNGVHSTSVILPPTAANVSSSSSSSKQQRRKSAPVSSTTAPAGPPPVLGADGTEKPKMSYAQLIAEALMSSEDRMLPLAEIYQTINKRYPYYRLVACPFIHFRSISSLASELKYGHCVFSGWT